MIFGEHESLHDDNTCLLCFVMKADGGTQWALPSKSRKLSGINSIIDAKWGRPDYG
jgi:hypothetical protein